ncbi:hypothetical protein M0805_004608 [Coniferiporia weirii]|nr:hypothetical protein M0805_004608 [Coniferiporia weirii]
MWDVLLFVLAAVIILWWKLCGPEVNDASGPTQPASSRWTGVRTNGNYYPHYHAADSSRPTSHNQAPANLHYARLGEAERTLPSGAPNRPVYSAHPYPQFHQPQVSSPAHNTRLLSRNPQSYGTYSAPPPVNRYCEDGRTTPNSVLRTLSPNIPNINSGDSRRGVYDTDSTTIENSHNFLPYKGQGGHRELTPFENEHPGERYREMARGEAKLRKIAFENSQRSFRLGKKAEAKRLSEKGKRHDDKAKQYNTLAAADIFAHNNPGYNSESTSSPPLLQCDLHGLYVQEASQHTRHHLVRCRQAGIKKTTLIVGKGSHSKGGDAKIKPAIMKMMKNTPDVVAAFHGQNEGRIVVEFSSIN